MEGIRVVPANKGINKGIVRLGGPRGRGSDPLEFGGFETDGNAKNHSRLLFDIPLR